MDEVGMNDGGKCRQSSSRWSPTTEQIRILKDLYYNNGVRSPTADQIQRISARLRHYGKIEGKNVFYWFQNHKARERQKKRFTSSSSSSSDHHYPNIFNPSPPNPLNGNGLLMMSSSSSSSLLAPNIPYGGSLMDKQLQEHSFIRESGGDVGRWVVEPYSCGMAPEMETLPLFPTYAEDIKMNCSGGGWYMASSTANGASLELTLNSYSSYNNNNNNNTNYNAKLPHNHNHN